MQICSLMNFLYLHKRSANLPWQSRVKVMVWCQMEPALWTFCLSNKS